MCCTSSNAFMAVNHEQFKFQRMPRSRNQMPYYGQCPDNEMPHMQRGHCFPDNYGKMDGSCNMGVSEFKSPMMNADPPPPPSKKKRRTSNSMTAAVQPPPSTIMPDLLPPPLTGYGDTIVASNPFDDTPPSPSMSHMNQMNHVNKHMGIRPCMSSAGNPMMDSMSSCQIVGSSMSCGPPVGSPIGCPSLRNCNPMSGPGSNTNCGPIGSPHTNCNSRQVNRSPLVCPSMGSNSAINSPMNVNTVHSMNRSPSSMGSPLNSVMVSNVRGNSPLEQGSLGISGSQKGSPMSVMSSHNMSNLNCGSPMGSPSNVPMSTCSSGNIVGSPITSPLSVPCSLGGGSELNINMNNVMNRSPMNAPPNSVMCNASMRGPSPIGVVGSMNGPMSMNMNMGPKSDMNMNDLVLRDNCSSPLHIIPKSQSGTCGMSTNNGPCSRQPDMSMQCNSMMSNQCSPGMSNVPCITGNMNRSQCGGLNPMGPMGMSSMYDGMPQCRPPMNRSHFPRGMPYSPNNMNIQPLMNGPGPNINMCPLDVGNMGCSAGNSPNNIHCPGENQMSNSQCMGPNMNQCSGGGSMFNSHFNPFEMNNARSSPSLSFNTSHEMGGMNQGGNFYGSNMPNPASCMSNMNPNVSGGPGPDLLVQNTVVNTVANSMKSEGCMVDSDIARVVCSITNDGSDDLNLIDENLLRGTKSEERKSTVKDLLLDEHQTDSKENEIVEGAKLENDGEAKIVEEKESKLGKGGKSDSTSCSPAVVASSASAVCTITASVSVAATNCPTSGVCTTTMSSRSGAVISEVSSSNENSSGEHPKVKNEGSAEEDEFAFRKLTTPSSNEKNENVIEDSLKDKIKHEPEEKLMENDFGSIENEKNKGEKSGAEDATNVVDNAVGEQRKDSNGAGVTIKVEKEDFFEGTMKNKSEPGGGVRTSGSSNEFNNNSSLIGGVTSFGVNLNVSLPSNDMTPMINNSSACMNDTMCGSPIISNMNMNRLAMPPHSMSQSTTGVNYQNKSMSMYTGRQICPSNKSKLYNVQNPNAPPIYTCGCCHKEINDNDQAILCESGCNFWFHRTCCGLTEDAYRLLTDEVYAEWACDKCLQTKHIPLVKLKP